MSTSMSGAEDEVLKMLAAHLLIEKGAVVHESLEYIANHLEDVRKRVCPYPDASETCDCKYGIGYGVNLNSSEKTGCPELREIIAVYRAAARGFGNS